MDIKTVYCPICDKHMYVETNTTIGHCPICNHHINPQHLDKPIEDYFSVTFDYSTSDVATLIVFRDDGYKMDVLNTLIGDDAIMVYKKLMGIKKVE